MLFTCFSHIVFKVILNIILDILHGEQVESCDINICCRHVAEAAPPHSHFIPMVLQSDIRKQFTGFECDQMRKLENPPQDMMSFGTNLDDLTTVASSYPSTRGMCSRQG